VVYSVKDTEEAVALAVAAAIAGADAATVAAIKVLPAGEIEELEQWRLRDEEYDDFDDEEANRVQQEADDDFFAANGLIDGTVDDYEDDDDSFYLGDSRAGSPEMHEMDGHEQEWHNIHGVHHKRSRKATKLMPVGSDLKHDLQAIEYKMGLRRMSMLNPGALKVVMEHEYGVAKDEEYESDPVLRDWEGASIGAVLNFLGRECTRKLGEKLLTVEKVGKNVPLEASLRLTRQGTVAGRQKAKGTPRLGLGKGASLFLRANTGLKRSASRAAEAALNKGPTLLTASRGEGRTKETPSSTTAMTTKSKTQAKGDSKPRAPTRSEAAEQLVNAKQRSMERAQRPTQRPRGRAKRAHHVSNFAEKTSPVRTTASSAAKSAVKSAAAPRMPRSTRVRRKVVRRVALPHDVTRPETPTWARRTARKAPLETDEERAKRRTAEEIARRTHVELEEAKANEAKVGSLGPPDKANPSNQLSPEHNDSTILKRHVKSTAPPTMSMTPIRQGRGPPSTAPTVTLAITKQMTLQKAVPKQVPEVEVPSEGIPRSGGMPWPASVELPQHPHVLYYTSYRHEDSSDEGRSCNVCHSAICGHGYRCSAGGDFDVCTKCAAPRNRTAISQRPVTTPRAPLLATEAQRVPLPADPTSRPVPTRPSRVNYGKGQYTNTAFAKWRDKRFCNQDQDGVDHADANRSGFGGAERGAEMMRFDGPQILPNPGPGQYHPYAETICILPSGPPNGILGDSKNEVAGGGGTLSDTQESDEVKDSLAPASRSDLAMEQQKKWAAEKAEWEAKQAKDKEQEAVGKHAQEVEKKEWGTELWTGRKDEVQLAQETSEAQGAALDAAFDAADEVCALASAAAAAARVAKMKADARAEADADAAKGARWVQVGNGGGGERRGTGILAVGRPGGRDWIEHAEAAPPSQLAAPSSLLTTTAPAGTAHPSRGAVPETVPFTAALSASAPLPLDPKAAKVARGTENTSAARGPKAVVRPASSAFASTTRRVDFEAGIPPIISGAYGVGGLGTGGGWLPAAGGAAAGGGGGDAVDLTTPVIPAVGQYTPLDPWERRMGRPVGDTKTMGGTTISNPRSNVAQDGLLARRAAPVTTALLRTPTADTLIELAFKGEKGDGVAFGSTAHREVCDTIEEYTEFTGVLATPGPGAYFGSDEEDDEEDDEDVDRLDEDEDELEGLEEAVALVERALGEAVGAATGMSGAHATIQAVERARRKAKTRAAQERRQKRIAERKVAKVKAQEEALRAANKHAAFNSGKNVEFERGPAGWGIRGPSDPLTDKDPAARSISPCKYDTSGAGFHWAGGHGPSIPSAGMGSTSQHMAHPGTELPDMAELGVGDKEGAYFGGFEIEALSAGDECTPSTTGVVKSRGTKKVPQMKTVRAEGRAGRADGFDFLGHGSIIEPTSVSESSRLGKGAAQAARTIRVEEWQSPLHRTAEIQQQQGPADTASLVARSTDLNNIGVGAKRAKRDATRGSSAFESKVASAQVETQGGPGPARYGSIVQDGIGSGERSNPAAMSAIAAPRASAASSSFFAPPGLWTTETSGPGPGEVGAGDKKGYTRDENRGNSIFKSNVPSARVLERSEDTSTANPGPGSYAQQQDGLPMRPFRPRPAPTSTRLTMHGSHRMRKKQGPSTR
jgi:hypothetical protein